MWIINLFISVLYLFNPFFLTNINYIYTYFTFKNGNPKDMLYLVPFNIYICLMGCIFGSFYIDNITDIFQWITGIDPYQVLYFEDQEYTKSIFQSLAIAYHIFPTIFLYVYGSMLLTHTDYRKWYQTMSFRNKIDFYTNYPYNCVNKVKCLLVIYCLCCGYLIYDLSTVMIWVIILSILPIINAIAIFITYNYDLKFLPYQTNVV
jgi:hypothetical protein